MKHLFRWFVLFILLFPSASHSRTLSQLRTDARVLVSDASSSTRQRFSDSTVNNFLNEAQRIAIARTWACEKSTTWELTVGATYYSLPSDFLAVRRLTREGLELTEQTMEALDGRSRGWEDANGTPTYYFMAFSSPALIGFAPFPNASSDTGTIKMDYYATMNAMSADSDSAFQGINRFEVYAHALPYYAASQMARVDGQSDLSNFLMAMFESYLKNMGEKIRERPNYLPSAAGRRQ